MKQTNKGRRKERKRERIRRKEIWKVRIGKGRNIEGRRYVKRKKI
jgi:hypothetical protein